VLRRIFGPNRNEVVGGWINLRNAELRNLYCSPDTIRIINSKRMRWAAHVASMEQKTNAYTNLVERPDVGKRIIIKNGSSINRAGLYA
jgi:hypothetical protein